jgi:hypothetical protein
MDGIHRETVNASGGIYEFDYTPSVSGMLTMGFKVYNLLGDSVLNESTTFLVVKADVAPTPAEDMVFTLDMFLHWMPVMLLVIVPAVMLGQELGAVGYITGLFFGVVAGLYAGILPTWVLYVTLLLVSIIAVVYMKGRGGG